MPRRFAGRLRLERLARGLTQRALAKRSGIGSGYISYLEAGKRPAPPTPIAAELGVALGLPPGTLERLAVIDRIEAEVLALADEFAVDLDGYTMALARPDGTTVVRATIGADNGTTWFATELPGG